MTDNESQTDRPIIVPVRYGSNPREKQFASARRRFPTLSVTTWTSLDSGTNVEPLFNLKGDYDVKRRHHSRMERSGLQVDVV